MFHRSHARTNKGAVEGCVVGLQAHGQPWRASEQGVQDEIALRLRQQFVPCGDEQVCGLDLRWGVHVCENGRGSFLNHRHIRRVAVTIILVPQKRWWKGVNSFRKVHRECSGELLLEGETLPGAGALLRQRVVQRLERCSRPHDDE